MDNFIYINFVNIKLSIIFVYQLTIKLFSIMAINTIQVPTTNGFIDVDINEIDYSDEIVLSSEMFLNDFILVKGFNETTQTNYIELRTKIGFFLQNVFCFEFSKEKLSEIVEWILNN